MGLCSAHEHVQSHTAAPASTGRNRRERNCESPSQLGSAVPDIATLAVGFVPQKKPELP